MNSIIKQGFSIKDIHPNWFLAFGIVTISASHMSFSIDLIGWIANVPFLIYLGLTKGWKSKVLFFIALIVAWSFVVLKIITAPLPYFMIFLFSIPIGLFHLPAYLIWSKYKAYKWGFLLFPVVLTFMEWIQYTFTPFASWGVAAYTQLHNLEVMQLLSLFGMPGLSFLICWVNISVAKSILDSNFANRSLQLALSTLVIVIIFGATRLDLAKSKGKDTVTLAAVGTTSEVSGLPLPSKESNSKVLSDLFSKTRVASKAGAKVIVWNEASFFTTVEDESIIIDSIQRLTKDLGIFLFASFVIPILENPFKYENKYVFINSNGEVEYSYLKHEPVPGEPAVRGVSEMRVSDINGTNIGGAICYDYDYPYLAMQFGQLETDIVVVPSSDWRGIDPIHSRMAAFRAVEQGHSILRSTRFGLSAAITPYGELIAQMSSFDINNRIMIAELPSKGITTLYSRIGDTFIYLCILFMLYFFITVFRNGK